MIHFENARTLGKCGAAPLGLAAALGLAVTLWPKAAMAGDSKLAVAGDFDLAWADAGNDTQNGKGLGGRLGWESSPLHILYFRPELGVHYYSFSGDGDPSILRGTGGARFGFDLIVRFGVYAHAGVANVDSSVSDIARTAFTYDVGAEVDVPLIPILDLGIHAAYESVSAGDAPKKTDYTVLGAHVGLRF